LLPLALIRLCVAVHIAYHSPFPRRHSMLIESVESERRRKDAGYRGEWQRNEPMDCRMGGEREREMRVPTSDYDERVMKQTRPKRHYLRE